MRFWGQNSISTNRDGTTANGRAKAFLTTFVWAPRSENAFLAVILGSKDVFEKFFGAHKSGQNEGKSDFWVKKSISTNRDGTTANGRAKAFIATFVWAATSENEFLAVKDIF